MVKRNGTANTSIEEEKGTMLKVNITPSVKARLKAICAVKQLKMQNVLGNIIKEYVEKNENVLQK